MSALLFENPVWFATGPLMFEEEAQDREEFIYHRPILLREAIELLAPRPGALVLDATCGGGGHSEGILKTGADVLALDQDPDAIAEATNRLSEFGNRVTLRKANFRHADRVLDELKVGKIGGAILDLGVSARQLENAERGFSLMRNGPLDMRMDPGSEKTADAIINSYSEEELTRLFRDLGDFISFAGRSDGEKFLSRTQPRIFRSTRMAGTAPEQGARSYHHYGKAGRAKRKRTAL